MTLNGGSVETLMGLANQSLRLLSANDNAPFLFYTCTNIYLSGFVRSSPIGLTDVLDVYIPIYKSESFLQSVTLKCEQANLSLNTPTEWTDLKN